jgi:hypothetical protein
MLLLSSRVTALHQKWALESGLRTGVQLVWIGSCLLHSAAVTNRITAWWTCDNLGFFSQKFPGEYHSVDSSMSKVSAISMLLFLSFDLQPDPHNDLVRDH